MGSAWPIDCDMYLLEMKNCPLQDCMGMSCVLCVLRKHYGRQFYELSYLDSGYA